MNETNFDWDDLRLFLAVARNGGLAAAASATGKSPPTLGRRMLALERRLGQDLFHRLPRGYTLTADGTALLDHATAVEARLHPLLSPRNGAVPVVKLSAGTWVTQILCAHVADIIATDQIRLRFIAADHVVDIARREALIGIRNHRPDGPGLAARKITNNRFAIYAKDATIQPWARVLGNTPSAKWVQTAAQNAPMIEVTSPHNALDLARAGVAKAVLPTFIGATLPDLRQISAPIAALEHEQWLVTHHEDRFVPVVRKVIDRTYAVLRTATDTATETS